MLLTYSHPAPILVAATRPTRCSGARVAIRMPPGWMPALADLTKKESGVGVERDDPYAVQRAERERLFQSLPAAGTPDYWKRIEGATAETALPLEVLARCVRERAQTGALDDARRIRAVIVRRIQTPVQARMRATALRSASRQKSDLAHDLEQECYVLLLREIRDPEPTFFCEHFMQALKRLMDHAEHSIMEREGFWKRRDVEKPKRVPANKQDSLDAPIAPGGPLTLGQSMPDPAAEDAYERVDLETDIAELLAALKPEDRELVRDLFWSNLTQEQVAERLHITDHTVRNRLKRILAQLRKDYSDGEEV